MGGPSGWLPAASSRVWAVHTSWMGVVIGQGASGGQHTAGRLSSEDETLVGALADSPGTGRDAARIHQRSAR